MGFLKKALEMVTDGAIPATNVTKPGALGAFDVPGQATLSLPAGRVYLTFCCALSDSSSPSDLTLTVTGPDGTPVEVGPTKAAGQSHSTFRGDQNWSTRRVGVVVIPAAGDYEVTASCGPTPFPKPELLVDIR
jgi:hypothetical protein